MVELGLFSIQDMNRSGMWAVVLNGKLVGGVREYEKFIDTFKEYRRVQRVPHSVSIYTDDFDHIIDIWSDAGRMIRPLINY